MISTAYRIKSSILFDNTDFIEGMKNLEMALYFEPKDSEIWFEKGYKNYTFQKYDFAIEDFTKSIEMVKIDKLDTLKWKYYFRGVSNMVKLRYEDSKNDLLM